MTPKVADAAKIKLTFFSKFTLYQWGYTGKKIYFVKITLSSLINGGAQE